MKQERLSQVQSELASLSATFNGLAASSASIDMLASQLGNVASEEDLAEITDALAAVQADVTELLQANSVINQSITISNLAILEFVETLIETQGTWGVSKICNNNVS